MEQDRWNPVPDQWTQVLTLPQIGDKTITPASPPEFGVF